jgi:hypothetical protein
MWLCYAVASREIVQNKYNMHSMIYYYVLEGTPRLFSDKKGIRTFMKIIPMKYLI